MRPIIGCAVVRGLSFTSEAIESLMGLQEDLHWGLGRNRRKVAIGVHDLSRVTPPFRYFGEDPARKFVPLDFAEEMSMEEMLQKHPKGKGYGHILQGCQRYPLIVDCKDQVLSFPPIINGQLTSVTEETEDLFIDVTGTDGMVHKALNIVVTSLAERGGKIESVRVMRSEGDFVSPNLQPSSWTVRAAEANKLIGFDLTAPQLAECLQRMRLGAVANGSDVQVQVPAYRADIMHSWDIFEDAAKAYGFEKLEARLPRTVTVGRAHPSEVRKVEIREVMTGLGYLETMPFTLTNEKVHFHVDAPFAAGRRRGCRAASHQRAAHHSTHLAALQPSGDLCHEPASSSAPEDICRGRRGGGEEDPYASSRSQHAQRRQFLGDSLSGRRRAAGAGH